MPAFIRIFYIIYMVSFVIVTIERACILYCIVKDGDVYRKSWFWKDTIRYYIAAPIVAYAIVLWCLREAFDSIRRSDDKM